MDHNIALVLGGGGSAGQAWQIGVIAGLAEAGFDLTEAADLVIGTSSGSTTAAWVRSGKSAAELLAAVLSPPARPSGSSPKAPSAGSGREVSSAGLRPGASVGSGGETRPAGLGGEMRAAGWGPGASVGSAGEMRAAGSGPEASVGSDRDARATGLGGAVGAAGLGPEASSARSGREASSAGTGRGARMAGAGRETSAGRGMAATFERMRAIGAAAGSAAELRRAMGAFGLESDALHGPEVAAQRRATVAARLLRHEWPDRPMIVVAVNAHTGELAAFDRDSGVDLVDAITASTALPGGGPTHDINGTHYINGGVRSAENADLASGYSTVVVLSPFGGWSRAPLPEGQFEGLRRDPAWGVDLDSQVAALRKEGSRVEVIIPDEDSRAAMGTNQMDPATRIPAARAGYVQGKREAGRLPVL